MSTPVPSITKTWRSAPYPAISPTRLENSAKGKSVVITGGGTGVGASIARAFAAAGSTQIAILGRRQTKLSETAQAIKAAVPETQILALSTDVTDVTSVSNAFREILKTFGHIDVFVNNAGAISAFAPAATAELADWWTAYETNVKGSLMVAQAFLGAARKDSFLLNITTGLAHMPVVIPGMSAYVSSKLAATKLFDYIASENPDIHVVNLQPGAIKSDLNNQAPVFDHIDLPGHFAVWLVGTEAEFLKGKFVWANWDVEELVQRKDEILKMDLLTIGLSGLSFQGWALSNLTKSDTKQTQ